MIYDSKETLMDVENLLHMEEDAVIEYKVDYEGLEEGKRYLSIPDGVHEIRENTFEEYNCSELVASLSRNLIMPEQYISEWEKRLSRRQLVKIEFPAELGKSVRKKAEYMVKKERRVRFLHLNLPASLERIHPDSYPVLLESITVDADNPNFTSRDGILFSKDMKVLIRYPGYNGADRYEVPEGVEHIAEGAFHNAFINKLILPSTLKSVEGRGFVNTVISELEIRNGLSEIQSETFVDCDIKKIVLPESLRLIGDYGFKGTSGIKELTCESDALSIGTGIFCNGNFEDVNWWPWEVIPKATFLNSNIKNITIPDGVINIEDYAFAGCYRAKKINLPDSVREIGIHSFDEGDSFSADIHIPKHLFQYVYRFPALSKVNKLKKSEIWKQREDSLFEEDIDTLQAQKKAMEKYIKSLNFIQNIKRAEYEKEIDLLESLLNRR